MKLTSFRTNSGHYICAEAGGGVGMQVNATRTVAGPWETFEAIERGDNLYAFKSHEGFYLRVEPDTGELMADRASVGEWEEWEVMPGQNGGIALRNPYTQLFIHAENGGGGALWVDREAAYADESFVTSINLLEPDEAPGPSPNPDPTPGAIDGNIRVDYLAFRDRSDRLVKPKVLHLMFLFSDFCHDHVERVKAEMAAASGLYDAFRFCDHLGYWDVAWGGKEVGPFAYLNRSGQQVHPTPDYYGKLEAFLNLARNYGLKVHHSRGDLNGLNESQIYRHMESVKQVQERVGLDEIMLNEACNEAWQNMPSHLDLVPTLKKMCSLMPVGPLRASSAADDGYGGETLEAAREYLVDVAYKHGYRGGETANRLGHIHAFAYETLRKLKVAGWEGEPTGPVDGVTVGREDNVEALALMGMQMAIFSQGATFMSGPGVFGRSAVFAVPGYHEWPAAIDLLPEDVMMWPEIIHGGETWRSVRVLGVDDIPGTRVDQRIDTDTGRFVATVYGQPGMHRLPVSRNADIRIYNPETLEGHQFTLKKGANFHVAFEKGRYIVGQLT